jgi:hypothetical protein
MQWLQFGPPELIKESPFVIEFTECGFDTAEILGIGIFKFVFEVNRGPRAVTKQR